MNGEFLLIFQVPVKRTPESLSQTSQTSPSGLFLLMSFPVPTSSFAFTTLCYFFLSVTVAITGLQNSEAEALYTTFTAFPFLTQKTVVLYVRECVNPI